MLQIPLHENYVPTDDSMAQTLQHILECMKRMDEKLQLFSNQLSALEQALQELREVVKKREKEQVLPPPLPLIQPEITDIIPPPSNTSEGGGVMANTFAVLRARNFNIRRGQPIRFVAEHTNL